MRQSLSAMPYTALKIVTAETISEPFANNIYNHVARVQAVGCGMCCKCTCDSRTHYQTPNGGWGGYNISLIAFSFRGLYSSGTALWAP